MTTARQAYEALLIELNKENAPNILLEDFNYLFNKAIYQYTNKRYNIYDISQQTTDDLRVLKATALLDAHKAYGKYNPNSDKPLNESALTDSYPTDEDFGFLGATYEVTLPSDYYHLLNCICIYKVNKTFKCYNAGDYWRRPATRLTADAYSLILDNFYLRPTYKRPYYYIHNVNQLVENPTNSYTDEKDEKGYPKWSGSTDIRETIDSYELDLILAELNEVNSEIEETKTLLKKVEGYYDEGVTKKVGLYWFNGSSTNNPTSIREIMRVNSTLQVTDTSLNFYYIESKGNRHIIYYYYIDDGGNLKSGKPYLSSTDNPSFDVIFSGSPKAKSEEYLELLNRKQELESKVPGMTFSTLPNTIDITINNNTKQLSNVERSAGIRYGNKSDVRLEIRYGSDDSLFELKKVYVDYLKTPQNIRLTQAQLDKTEDTSQVLEFPDYVCQEIINELVHVVMENSSNERIQTHPVVSLSIANPTQQLAETQS